MKWLQEFPCSTLFMNAKYFKLLTLPLFGGDVLAFARTHFARAERVVA